MYTVIIILVSTIICKQMSVDRVFRCIRIYFVQKLKRAPPKRECYLWWMVHSGR